MNAGGITVRSAELVGVEGVRFLSTEHRGVGVLTIAGSSGRVDTDRARLFAERGAIAESIRWFGGQGQNPGPWEISIETFQARLFELRSDCDRVIICGTSFGAAAALLTASITPFVDCAVGFAPSDVVWAGVRPDGTQSSHWTIGGEPVPFVPFADDWEPGADPPSYAPLYTPQSRCRTSCLDRGRGDFGRRSHRRWRRSGLAGGRLRSPDRSTTHRCRPVDDAHHPSRSRTPSRPPRGARRVRRSANGTWWHRRGRPAAR